VPFMTGHRPIRGGMRKHVRWSAGSLSALLFFFAALAASPSVSVAQQSSSAPNGGTLRITGEVSHPIVLHEVVLHEADLATLSRQTVHIVDDKGAAVTYEGVPVAELLRRADAPLGKQLRGSRMKLYVVVEAADGYRAVFALAEFDPDFTDRVILLADRRDGHPLSSKEGPFRIVVPGEKRHARWVREVTALVVQEAR
jgi:DMSO/TMAO reductase YedYZ molybdopterin-dependent catalytic subunit